MAQSNEDLKATTNDFLEDAKSHDLDSPDEGLDVNYDEKSLLDLIENEKSENDLLDSDSKTEEDLVELDDEPEEKKLSTELKEEEWQDILGSGVILKKTLKKGIHDTRPQKANKCRISYVCKLENDTVVETAENVEIRLGECDVIQGLDVTLGLLDVNEQCILKIGPRLAYGEKGLPPLIPANSTVIYELELHSVEPEDEIDSLSLRERKQIGNKKRERGNWWYQKGENTLAIQCYRRALDYLDEVEGGVTGPLSEGGEKPPQTTDAELQALLEDRISVCNNMAAAQIKMELYDQALMSLQTVLRCQPENVKALYRKAKVMIVKNDLEGALTCLEKCKDLQPDDAIIQKELSSVTNLIQKQKNSEREYARRMFGGPVPSKTDTKQSSVKQRAAQSNRHKIWATVCATFAVGLAGVAAYKLKYT